MMHLEKLKEQMGKMEDMTILMIKAIISIGDKHNGFPKSTISVLFKERDLGNLGFVTIALAHYLNNPNTTPPTF